MITKVEVLKGRTKIWPRRKLNELSFDRGWTALVGDNGSGKSLTLDLLSGLEVEAGIHLLKHNGAGADYRVNVDRRTKVVAYDFKQIMDSGRRNIGFESGILGIETLAMQLIPQSDGERMSSCFIHWASTIGQQMQDASWDWCLLLDEPETSSSLMTQEFMFHAFKTYAEQPHIQVICSSHSPLVYAYANSVIELTNGYKQKQFAILKKVCG